MTAYDALLVVSFGGPEGRDDVLPFLENVTRGRGIPRERLLEVAEHYYAFDGVSPINRQNREMIAALEARLAERGLALPVYFGNRNWHPYLADAFRELAADGKRRVLALLTSAYSSYSGCRQYRENIADALAETNLTGKVTVDRIRQYFDHPGFIEPFAEGLAAALTELAAGGLQGDDVKLLFVTHSLPLSMSRTSGPPGRFPDEGGAYVAQHLAAARCIIDAARPLTEAPMPDWELVYQSRSGPPYVPWLEPDINDALVEEARQGRKAVVVIPHGFVSDHLEVVWDLDHEAAETAAEHGLVMKRVATPGTHPRFIDGLVDLIEEVVHGKPAQALSDLGPWPNICRADCCRNVQQPDKPAVAQTKPLQRER